MLRIGQTVVKGTKTGTVVHDEMDDVYGYGTRVVQVAWNGGRTTWCLAKNVKAI